MKLSDESGGIAAARHACQPCVTVVVDSMQFHSPVNIGDLVTFDAEVSWVGRTSIETRVVVTAEKVLSGEVTHTNTAYFVYVALDDTGCPTPVPPLLCVTDEEKARFERGEARRARRLSERS
jgi:acyl-CoA hydrolase